MFRSCYLSAGKRLLDLLLGLPLLVVSLPLLALLAVLVRWRLGSPVLFRQTRIGWRGQEFTLYKFRTMKDVRGADGRLLADAQRLTRLGRFLRSTSLDELPELWNVLRGEMSLVGPRPLLPEYLPRYSAVQARRHEVRPGLTGLAQVNGRNQLDWESRFQLDVYYVDHVSFWHDFSILAKTFLAVAGRSGVNAEGHATMPPFLGTPSEPPRDAHFKMAGPGVAVLGAGGHAKVVIATLQAAGHTVLAVYDDDARRWGGTLLGVPIRGSLATAQADGTRQAIIAIGDNDTRRRIAERVSFVWQSAIHPDAIVHPSAVVEPGSLICAGAIVQPESRIGGHAIVNTGATVDHDCRLEAYCSIGPGAHLAGNVSVGSGAAIGIGACVIPGIDIGDETVVGAGTVVICDLPPRVVAVGSPARIIRELHTLQVA